MGFQSNLSEIAAQGRSAVLEVSSILERYTIRHMSKLSRQEIDLLNTITEEFDHIALALSKLSTFAKYTEDL